MTRMPSWRALTDTILSTASNLLDESYGSWTPISYWGRFGMLDLATKELWKTVQQHGYKTNHNLIPY